MFRGSVAFLRAKIDDWSLVPTLSEQYRHQLGRSSPPSEVRSWERSLNVLSQDLIEAGLAEVEALVEYQLPLTSKRADVVLCGTHPERGTPQYVVVELKQWSYAHLLEDSEDVCVLEGMSTRLHPVEQVRRYCSHLRDFAAALSDDTAVGIAGVAYLHNATNLDLKDLWAYPEDEQGRMFTGQRRGEFLSYLKSQLAPTTGQKLPTCYSGLPCAPASSCSRWPPTRYSDVSSSCFSTSSRSRSRW